MGMVDQRVSGFASVVLYLYIQMQDTIVLPTILATGFTLHFVMDYGNTREKDQQVTKAIGQIE